jgi:hypothetical protein
MDAAEWICFTSAVFGLTMLVADLDDLGISHE